MSCNHHKDKLYIFYCFIVCNNKPAEVIGSLPNKGLRNCVHYVFQMEDE